MIGVRRNGQTAVAADGQVTLGETTILKHRARKVVRIAGGKVVFGLTGSEADRFDIQGALEASLNSSSDLRSAALASARNWPSTQLQVIVADRDGILLIAGEGDVIEPDDGIAGIGSGGAYALAAARALVENTDLSAEAIARESIRIASEICVFTNAQLTVELV